MATRKAAAKKVKEDQGLKNLKKYYLDEWGIDLNKEATIEDYALIKRVGFKYRNEEGELVSFSMPATITAVGTNSYISENEIYVEPEDTEETQPKGMNFLNDEPLKPNGVNVII